MPPTQHYCNRQRLHDSHQNVIKFKMHLNFIPSTKSGTVQHKQLPRLEENFSLLRELLGAEHNPRDLLKFIACFI